MDIRGKRALVMGLGVHGGGLGVARFLAERGADVTVTDLRDAAALQPTLDVLADLPIRYVLGQHREEDFRNTDIVIRNPGVPRESRFLQIARAAGASIEMEMTLFFRLCPGPILGITGTKGKTTTTLLVGAMLREQFPDTVVAGNLRVSALEQLPKIGPQTPVVLELSSWQLEGLGEAKLSPPYACYLNLYPDHLDRYGSMDAYADAKEQIFLHQRKDDVAVFNSRLLDYSDVYSATDRSWQFWKTSARQIWFLNGDVPFEEDVDDQLNPGQHFEARDSYVGWGNGSLTWESTASFKVEYIEETICTLEDVQLAGDHNLANIAAAAALAKAFGVTNDNIRNAIRKFSGVPDRLEFVREVNGVRYINDTTATAPEAAIAALHSFDAPIVLLAGGADKNLTFDRLAETISERAKAVVLLQGTATEKLQAELSSIVIEGPFDNFEDAVRRASQLAEPGDVVLLSPGCASFGMFHNEFHRGEEFRRIVGEL